MLENFHVNVLKMPFAAWAACFCLHFIDHLFVQLNSGMGLLYRLSTQFSAIHSVVVVVVCAVGICLSFELLLKFRNLLKQREPKLLSL